MSELRQFDLIIVGGGIAGLAMARCLSAADLSLALIDREEGGESLNSLRDQARQPEFDPRVSALTIASQHLLDELGVWDDLVSARVCPYREMFVWDAEGTGSIHFSAEQIQREALGHIVENRLIIAALMEKAQQQKNLQIIRPAAVEKLDSRQGISAGDLNKLRLADGSQLACRLLIAADGADSIIRQQAGFKTRQWSYEHKAIVTTVETEKPHRFTAWQRFMQTGPMAFLPLHWDADAGAGQHHSSIVWSCNTERAEALSALSDEDFRNELGQAFEWKLGSIKAASRRYSFPLWQRHATSYVKPGIALVGDAAHSLHPLAGQGVNLGLADVKVLTAVICEALKRGEDYASEQALSPYQRRRKGDNLGMMLLMETFKRLFEADGLPLRWLRNRGVSMVDRSPFVKRQLMRRATGL